MCQAFASELRNLHGNILIYLDTDILCCSAIPDFDTLPFDPDTVLLATDFGEQHHEVCGTYLGRYFNSGILFINMPQWKERRVGDVSTELVCKYRPKYPDQDALNAVVKDNWRALPEHMQHCWEVKADTVFVHYVAAKPWEPWNFHLNRESVRYFIQCATLFEPDTAKWISFKANKQAWINFTRYKGRTASKWLARLMLKRGHYAAAAYFYLQHLKIKVKQKGIIGILLLRSNTRT